MVIQPSEEGISITVHARTLFLQFKESTTLTVGSFDATSVSRTETFLSRASKSLQWYPVKGNTTLSLPSPFRFYFFSQRRYTTKLNTITRVISKSFSFTDTRKNIYDSIVSVVTSTCLAEAHSTLWGEKNTRNFARTLQHWRRLYIYTHKNTTALETPIYLHTQEHYSTTLHYTTHIFV